MRSRKIYAAVLFLLLLCIPLSASAHSGRTDSNGGHYVGSTGDYHYHHGYSAHQHPNGVCPYDDPANVWETLLSVFVFFSTIILVPIGIYQIRKRRQAKIHANKGFSPQYSPFLLFNPSNNAIEQFCYNCVTYYSILTYQNRQINRKLHSIEEFCFFFSTYLAFLLQSFRTPPRLYIFIMDTFIKQCTLQHYPQKQICQLTRHLKKFFRTYQIISFFHKMDFTKQIQYHLNGSSSVCSRSSALFEKKLSHFQKDIARRTGLTQK